MIFFHAEAGLKITMSVAFSVPHLCVTIQTRLAVSFYSHLTRGFPHLNCRCLKNVLYPHTLFSYYYLLISHLTS